jgi:hypothetical protein
VVCRDGGWSLDSVLRYVDGIRGARCHSSEPPLGSKVGQRLDRVRTAIAATATGDVYRNRDNHVMNVRVKKMTAVLGSAVVYVNIYLKMAVIFSVDEL